MSMTDEQRREFAIKRLKDKNDFRIHLLIYLTVNLMLVVIWAFTGGIAGTVDGYSFAYFWPIFPIVGWGVGVIAHGYRAYVANSYTEDQIQREMSRIPR
jgi:2TM domain